MVHNATLKTKAIELRKQGLSYKQILERVPVAKSTLSLWLQSVQLAKVQKQRLTKKRLQGALKGAQARRRQKEALIESIKSAAHCEIGTITERELWLIGVALYWAEGTKEKIYRPGSGLNFNNSDPAMIKLYIRWLEQTFKLQKQDIHLSLLIHDTKRGEIETIKKFWLEYLDYPRDTHVPAYFKMSKIRTVRKNTGALYFGMMRVRVFESSGLIRRVTGWIEGILGATG